jgi:predicted nuclease of predicted toxin-antitoxin system
MRFLADENFPGSAVRELRAAGHDVEWVRETSPGMTDASVLAWASREERVVLTFDKDFGELAWRSALPAKCGVVLFRLPMPGARDAGAVLARLVAQRDDWTGHFTVVEPGRFRMRALGDA